MSLTTSLLPSLPFPSLLLSSFLPPQMDPKTFFTLKTSLHNFAIIFFFITVLAIETSSLDPKFEACEPKSCGNGPNISYPFWLADKQESFCGYRNLEITCGHDIYPVLIISGHDYIIKDVFYANQSFLVANSEAYEDKCPIPLHNLSLDGTVFSFTPSHINFSFFYNCTQEPPLHITYPLDCISDGSLYSFATFHKEALEKINYSLESCQVFVNTPLEYMSNGGDDAANLLQMNYTEILKMGFLLNWTANSCSSCQKSGGRCGFDNNEYACFCHDGPHLKTCNHGKEKLNWTRKILIGFGSGIVGIAIMCMIFYFYQCRKKKRNAASTLLRNISSDPSSMADVEKGGNLYGVHLFSYFELEEATNNFDSAKELGDGGFGTVYYGKLRDGRVVAVKRLYENNFKRVEQFMNEVVILTRIRHRHLVSLYGCTSRHSRELLLVYEYVPNGTVADHLHGERAKPGELPWPVRLKIAIETASALTYLHASEIIHRDVKTNNILLDNDFCVKVADFGLSRLFPTDVTHVSTAPQGTPGYVDPEYHECYQLTYSSDVFSFGVVLIELISSKPAVDITRHRHEINLSNMAINKIQNHALHELVDQSLGFESDSKVRQMITAVAELAFQCLQGEKGMRPSMVEVLESLKHIQSEDCNAGKVEEVDIPSDDVVLLKSLPQLSPDSVTINWVSRSTTPNTSN